MLVEDGFRENRGRERGFRRGGKGRATCSPEIRGDNRVVGGEGYPSRGAVRLPVAALVVVLRQSARSVKVVVGDQLRCVPVVA